MRGMVIAGTHSGCGKTTVTLGLLAALSRAGYRVQPFKAGPDFIDAGLHDLVTGRPSRNLDLWMCGAEYVSRCYRRHAAAADIAVVEGVMGLYDGEYSTARLAALLRLPVILVVDACGMAESAGAMVKGYATFRAHRSESTGEERHVTFAGAIFNRVASENHFFRLRESVRDIPVLGYVPRDLDLEIPHRHLGLVTAEESPLGKESLVKLADVVLEHIDIDKILQAAGGGKREDVARAAGEDAKSNKPIRIAIARDRAFSFYYEDNLDMLRAGGAEIVPFSPLLDPAIPAVDAVYFGGGYPELHAEALSRNESMRASVLNWAESGKALYAECGGLMYLSRGIRDFEGNFFPLVGLFPFETEMLKKPCLGYREIVLQEDCMLGKRGERFRGHEFHYSAISDGNGTDDGPEKTFLRIGPGSRAYQVSDARGRSRGPEGYRYKNALASYIHLHFGSNAAMVEKMATFLREK